MELGLVVRLRAAWIAGILPIIFSQIPIRKLDPVRRIVLVFAQRGKITQSSTQKFSVPQRFFSHFYVVAVVWNTVLVIATGFYAYKTARPISEPLLLYSTIVSYLTGGISHVDSSNISDSSIEHMYMVCRSLFLLLLMEAQVLRRLFETLYVFKYSPSARMHVIGYLTGLFFYTAAPLSLCCNVAPAVFKFVENWMVEFIAKGKDRMLVVSEFDMWVLVNPLMRLGWYTWFGTAMFLWGWIHQLRCHAILGSLRDNRKQADKYLIPHGDWFNYVSSPHYLAEIIIYCGLVVASGGDDLTIWLLLGFVVANLGIAAAETRRWYLRKFDNYPTNRYAIIPFVY